MNIEELKKLIESGCDAFAEYADAKGEQQKIVTGKNKNIILSASALIEECFNNIKSREFVIYEIKYITKNHEIDFDDNAVFIKNTVSMLANRSGRPFNTGELSKIRRTIGYAFSKGIGAKDIGDWLDANGGSRS